MSLKTFGSHLQTLRTTRKLSQAQLTQRSKLSTSYISRVENGQRLPHPQKMRLLDSTLQVQTQQLFKEYLSTEHPVPISDERTQRYINQLSPSKKLLLFFLQGISDDQIDNLTNFVQNTRRQFSQF